MDAGHCASMAGEPWSLGYFTAMLAMWIIMMVVVPSAIPMVLIYASIVRKAAREGSSFGFHRSFRGRLYNCLEPLCARRNDSSVGLRSNGSALADDDEQQHYSRWTALASRGRLPANTVQRRLSATLSLSNSVPRLPLETRGRRRLSDGHRTRLLLSRVLLGAYGTALLWRSDEPVVDWRSDAIRFTWKKYCLSALWRDG